jgi:hypothetical protein
MSVISGSRRFTPVLAALVLLLAAINGIIGGARPRHHRASEGVVEPADPGKGYSRGGHGQGDHFPDVLLA